MPEPVPYRDSEKIRSYPWQGDTWYRVSDICLLLGIGDARKAMLPLPSHCHRKLDLLDLSDPRGMVQETWVVNLSGLFLLVIASRKPNARAYQEWMAQTLAQSLIPQQGEDL